MYKPAYLIIFLLLSSCSTTLVGIKEGTYIDKVIFKSNKGIKLAEADTYGALSANPIIIIDFYQDLNLTNIIAYDTKGNTFKLDQN